MRRKDFVLLTNAWLVVFVLAMAVGCGKGSADGVASGKPAKPTIPPSQRLAGVWTGTMVVDEESVKGHISADQVDALRKQEMTIQFRPDGTLTTTTVIEGKQHSFDETWQHVRGEGDELTVKMIGKDGQQKDHAFLFDGDDSFLMPVQTEVANLGAMRFTRQR